MTHTMGVSMVRLASDSLPLSVLRYVQYPVIDVHGLTHLFLENFNESLGLH